jgi:hypothetical protein
MSRVHVEVWGAGMSVRPSDISGKEKAMETERIVGVKPNPPEGRDDDRGELFLPCKEAVLPEDSLLLFPTYWVPLEVFERGLLTRPGYWRAVVLVDGITGKPEVHREVLPAPVKFPPFPVKAACRRLPFRVGPGRAAIRSGGVVRDLFAARSLCEGELLSELLGDDDGRGRAGPSA